MKAKLVILFAALFCFTSLIAEKSFAGANADAKIKIKLLRQSQLATWTSVTASADTLLEIAEGESFWVKIYAVDVSDLFGWQVQLSVNKAFLTYDPTSGSNYKVGTSAAGETGILLLKDESGIAQSDAELFVNEYYDDTGKIEIARTFKNASIASSPALASDSGFVTEFKLTARTGVAIGDSAIIKTTKVLFTDTNGETDQITAAGLDTVNVTFTPVELAAFSSIVIDEKDVKLEWVTTSETNNFGFYVERSEDGVNFETVEFIEGNGTTTEEIAYSYTDTEVNSGTFFYRLKFVAFDGSMAYSDVLEASVGVPADYLLSQNYPNPFNPTTTIKFSLKESGFVELNVYNVIGQLIETLAAREMSAGYHSFNFDASKIASGVYFYSIKANSFSDIKKMVVVK